MFEAQSVDPRTSLSTSFKRTLTKIIAEMTGGLSLYLDTPRADFLRGSYVSVNWDVEEMEEHAEEIKEKKLLSTAFLNAKLGPKGYQFEGTS